MLQRNIQQQYIFRKKSRMLSFSPILSQSRATQSLKNFLRGLCPLTLSLGGVPPALLVLAALANVRPSFISLFATLILNLMIDYSILTKRFKEQLFIDTWCETKYLMNNALFITFFCYFFKVTLSMYIQFICTWRLYFFFLNITCKLLI